MVTDQYGERGYLVGIAGTLTFIVLCVCVLICVTIRWRIRRSQQGKGPRRETTREATRHATRQATRAGGHPETGAVAINVPPTPASLTDEQLNAPPTPASALMVSAPDVELLRAAARASSPMYPLPSPDRAASVAAVTPSELELSEPPAPAALPTRTPATVDVPDMQSAQPTGFVQNANGNWRPFYTFTPPAAAVDVSRERWQRTDGVAMGAYPPPARTSGSVGFDPEAASDEPLSSSTYAAALARARQARTPMRGGSQIGTSFAVQRVYTTPPQTTFFV